MASLYLIPTPLGTTSLEKIFPSYNIEIINRLNHFVVENVRTARRFLKQISQERNINEVKFYLLNEHSSKEELSCLLEPLYNGFDLGLMSEAGCPAVSDPGADLVALAHKNDFTVIPLIGPSSVLLSLMASGFNGQNFEFVGYLPVQSEERIKTLRRLEAKVYAENQTQIFIETPYRNMKMLETILKVCQPSTQLCIAADVTLESEFIKTKSIGEWRKNLPDLQNKPCIFLLYKTWV